MLKASLDTDGDQLRLARLALRWTQDELADRSGVNRVTIAYIEGGRIEKARIGTLRALAHTLEDAGIEFTAGGVQVQGTPALSRPVPLARLEPFVQPKPSSSRAVALAADAIPEVEDDQAELRKRLAARIGRTKTLAGPAKEIGITSQTLAGFLAGGRAYTKTRERIEAYLGAARTAAGGC